MLSGNAGVLDKKLDDMRFGFYGKIPSRSKEQRAMNKRGLEVVNGILGETSGKLYVEKYFPAEAKKKW